MLPIGFPKLEITWNDENLFSSIYPKLTERLAGFEMTFETIYKSAVARISRAVAFGAIHASNTKRQLWCKRRFCLVMSHATKRSELSARDVSSASATDNHHVASNSGSAV